jgi:hypothetical protein
MYGLLTAGTRRYHMNVRQVTYEYWPHADVPPSKESDGRTDRYTRLIGKLSRGHTSQKGRQAGTQWTDGGYGYPS